MTRGSETRKDAQMPRVSVLIPCYNERHRIRRCLDSLLDNDYPEDRIELVVIDGSSDDGSCTVVEELAQAHSNLRTIENPERQKPQGLNPGIRATDSDVVVRADAHAWYPRNSALAARLQRSHGSLRRPSWLRQLKLAAQYAGSGVVHHARLAWTVRAFGEQAAELLRERGLR